MRLLPAIDATVVCANSDLQRVTADKREGRITEIERDLVQRRRTMHKSNSNLFIIFIKKITQVKQARSNKAGPAQPTSHLLNVSFC